MNVGQLKAEFRTDADDQAEPYLWSDPEFLRWLNQAQEEACIRKGLLFEAKRPEICRIAVTVAGGNTYQLNELICEIVNAYLVDASGTRYPLTLTDRVDLDALRPRWRETTERPEFIIHRDNTIQLGSIIDAPYTVWLEVHRLPIKCLKEEADIPEIHQIHHKHLLQWVLHRAYEKPDAETLNPGKSDEALARFTEYFGERPTADLRKSANANKPHRNKLW
jgi:hypothetical protein